MIAELVMDDQLDDEQDPDFEEQEDIPEATFAIDGLSNIPLVLNDRACMGHWTPSILDTIFRQTRPRCRSSSCSSNRSLLAVISFQNNINE